MTLPCLQQDFSEESHRYSSNQITRSWGLTHFREYLMCKPSTRWHCKAAFSATFCKHMIILNRRRWFRMVEVNDISTYKVSNIWLWHRYVIRYIKWTSQVWIYNMTLSSTLKLYDYFNSLHLIYDFAKCIRFIICLCQMNYIFPMLLWPCQLYQIYYMSLANKSIYYMSSLNFKI